MKLYHLEKISLNIVRNNIIELVDQNLKKSSEGEGFLLYKFVFQFRRLTQLLYFIIKVKKFITIRIIHIFN